MAYQHWRSDGGGAVPLAWVGAKIVFSPNSKINKRRQKRVID